MNKRADRPKRALPLTDDSKITDAQIEKFLRDNHDAIDEKLQKGREDIAAGRVRELEPLPEMLRRVRQHRATRTNFEPSV